MSEFNMKEGLTLYVRNPEKKYAFEKIGEVAFWHTYGKAIWISGQLYTLTTEPANMTKGDGSK